VTKRKKAPVKPPSKNYIQEVKRKFYGVENVEEHQLDVRL
jgi:hypothetical protein